MEFTLYSKSIEKPISSIVVFEDKIIIGSEIGTPVYFDGEEYKSVCLHLGSEQGVKSLFVLDGFLHCVTTPNDLIYKIYSDKTFIDLTGKVIQPEQPNVLYAKRNDFTIKDGIVYVSGTPVQSEFKINCMAQIGQEIVFGAYDGCLYVVSGIRRKR
jgi:hypothetical protein